MYVVLADRLLGRRRSRRDVLSLPIVLWFAREAEEMYLFLADRLLVRGEGGRTYLALADRRMARR